MPETLAVFVAPDAHRVAGLQTMHPLDQRYGISPFETAGFDDIGAIVMSRSALRWSGEPTQPTQR